MGENEDGKDQKSQDADESQDSTTGDAPGADDQQDDGKVEFDAAQQAKLDAIITERLARAREKWLREQTAAEEKAAEEAESQRLEEQKEFEKLAAQRAEKIVALEAKVAELKGVQEQVTRYEGALKVYLDGLREGVPEHLIPLLDRMDVVDQMTYLANHASDLRKGTAGVPATPKARGTGQLDDEERRKRSVGIRKIW